MNPKLMTHFLHKFAGISGRIFILVVMASCASYYHQHWDFNKEFERGDLEKALETLQRNDDLERSKSKFIYLVNKGLLFSVLGRYEESNAYFEKAYLFGEDYRINYLNEAASYLTNPTFTVYRGEDHEHLYVLYFKALNFLKMHRHEEALVECRRLNIRLQKLSDKYTSDKKFQRDAFIHTLMGIIYQSDGDYNNAFIAYRNAVDIYENDYVRMFSVSVPEQLKTDLLHTAWWMGFYDEYEQYKEKFSMQEFTPSKPEANLVFFWHNGLAPVKDEWSINFLIHHQPDNWVVFSNADLGITFPFHMEDKKDKDDKSNLADLEVFRVAFPKYIERLVYYEQAFLLTDSTKHALYLGENISEVAFYSLKERMMIEFGKGLLRAAVKKATEHSVRKKDEQLGAIIGLMNAITEKADTRNWQTLPHSIYYTRMSLKEGSNPVKFSMVARNGETMHYDFNYNAKRGETLFHTFSSLESQRASNRYY